MLVQALYLMLSSQIKCTETAVYVCAFTCISRPAAPAHSLHLAFAVIFAIGGKHDLETSWLGALASNEIINALSC